MFAGNFHKEKSEPGESKKSVQTEGGPVLPRIYFIIYIYRERYDGCDDDEAQHGLLSAPSAPSRTNWPAPHRLNRRRGHGVRLSASRQPGGGRALATTSLRHAAYLRNQSLRRARGPAWLSTSVPCQS